MTSSRAVPGRDDEGLFRSGRRRVRARADSAEIRHDAQDSLRLLLPGCGAPVRRRRILIRILRAGLLRIAIGV